jgi:hypothetical protein
MFITDDRTVTCGMEATTSLTLHADCAYLLGTADIVPIVSSILAAGTHHDLSLAMLAILQRVLVFPGAIALLGSQEGIMESLVKAMSASKADREVQLFGCQCLTALISGHSECAQHILSSGTLSELVSLQNDFVEDEELLVEVTKALITTEAVGAKAVNNTASWHIEQHYGFVGATTNLLEHPTSEALGVECMLLLLGRAFSMHLGDGTCEPPTMKKANAVVREAGASKALIKSLSGSAAEKKSASLRLLRTGDSACYVKVLSVLGSVYTAATKALKSAQCRVGSDVKAAMRSSAGLEQLCALLGKTIVGVSVAALYKLPTDETIIRTTKLLLCGSRVDAALVAQTLISLTDSDAPISGVLTSGAAPGDDLAAECGLLPVEAMLASLDNEDQKEKEEGNTTDGKLPKKYIPVIFLRIVQYLYSADCTGVVRAVIGPKSLTERLCAAMMSVNGNHAHGAAMMSVGDVHTDHSVNTSCTMRMITEIAAGLRELVLTTDYPTDNFELTSAVVQATLAICTCYNDLGGVGGTAAVVDAVDCLLALLKCDGTASAVGEQLLLNAAIDEVASAVGAVLMSKNPETESVTELGTKLSKMGLRLMALLTQAAPNSGSRMATIDGLVVLATLAMHEFASDLELQLDGCISFAAMASASDEAANNVLAVNGSLRALIDAYSSAYDIEEGALKLAEGDQQAQFESESTKALVHCLAHLIEDNQEKAVAPILADIPKLFETLQQLVAQREAVDTSVADNGSVEALGVAALQVLRGPIHKMEFSAQPASSTSGGICVDGDDIEADDAAQKAIDVRSRISKRRTSVLERMVKARAEGNTSTIDSESELGQRNGGPACTAVVLTDRRGEVIELKPWAGYQIKLTVTFHHSKSGNESSAKNSDADGAVGFRVGQTTRPPSASRTGDRTASKVSNELAQHASDGSARFSSICISHPGQYALIASCIPSIYGTSATAVEAKLEGKRGGKHNPLFTASSAKFEVFPGRPDTVHFSTQPAELRSKKQATPGSLNEVVVTVVDQFGFVVDKGPFSMPGRRPMVSLVTDPKLGDDVLRGNFSSTKQEVVEGHARFTNEMGLRVIGSGACALLATCTVDNTAAVAAARAARVATTAAMVCGTTIEETAKGSRENSPITDDSVSMNSAVRKMSGVGAFVGKLAARRRSSSPSPTFGSPFSRRQSSTKSSLAAAPDSSPPSSPTTFKPVPLKPNSFVLRCTSDIFAVRPSSAKSLAFTSAFGTGVAVPASTISKELLRPAVQIATMCMSKTESGITTRATVPPFAVCKLNELGHALCSVTGCTGGESIRVVISKYDAVQSMQLCREELVEIRRRQQVQTGDQGGGAARRLDTNLTRYIRSNTQGVRDQLVSDLSGDFDDEVAVEPDEEHIESTIIATVLNGVASFDEFPNLSLPSSGFYKLRAELVNDESGEASFECQRDLFCPDFFFAPMVLSPEDEPPVFPPPKRVRGSAISSANNPVGMANKRLVYAAQALGKAKTAASCGGLAAARTHASHAYAALLDLGDLHAAAVAASLLASLEASVRHTSWKAQCKQMQAIMEVAPAVVCDQESGNPAPLVRVGQTCALKAKGGAEVSELQLMVPRLHTLVVSFMRLHDPSRIQEVGTLLSKFESGVPKDAKKPSRSGGPFPEGPVECALNAYLLTMYGAGLSSLPEQQRWHSRLCRTFTSLLASKASRGSNCGTRMSFAQFERACVAPEMISALPVEASDQHLFELEGTPEEIKATLRLQALARARLDRVKLLKMLCNETGSALALPGTVHGHSGLYETWNKKKSQAMVAKFIVSPEGEWQLVGGPWDRTAWRGCGKKGSTQGRQKRRALEMRSEKFVHTQVIELHRRATMAQVQPASLAPLRTTGATGSLSLDECMKLGMEQWIYAYAERGMERSLLRFLPEAAPTKSERSAAPASPTSVAGKASEAEVGYTTTLETVPPQQWYALASQFARADLDGNGTLTKTEHAHLFSDQGCDLSDPAVAAHIELQFQRLDVNGSGRVQFREYLLIAAINWARTTKAVEVTKALSSMFGSKKPGVGLGGLLRGKASAAAAAAAKTPELVATPTIIAVEAGDGVAAIVPATKYTHASQVDVFGLGPQHLQFMTEGGSAEIPAAAVAAVEDAGLTLKQLRQRQATAAAAAATTATTAATPGSVQVIPIHVALPDCLLLPETINIQLLACPKPGAYAAASAVSPSKPNRGSSARSPSPPRSTPTSPGDANDSALHHCRIECRRIQQAAAAVAIAAEREGDHGMSGTVTAGSLDSLLYGTSGFDEVDEDVRVFKSGQKLALGAGVYHVKISAGRGFAPQYRVGVVPPVGAFPPASAPSTAGAVAPTVGRVQAETIALAPVPEHSKQLRVVLSYGDLNSRAASSASPNSRRASAARRRLPNLSLTYFTGLKDTSSAGVVGSAQATNANWNVTPRGGVVHKTLSMSLAPGQRYGIVLRTPTPSASSPPSSPAAEPAPFQAVVRILDLDRGEVACFDLGAGGNGVASSYLCTAAIATGNQDAASSGVRISGDMAPLAVQSNALAGLMEVTAKDARAGVEAAAKLVDAALADEKANEEAKDPFKCWPLRGRVRETFDDTEDEDTGGDHRRELTSGLVHLSVSIAPPARVDSDWLAAVSVEGAVERKARIQSPKANKKAGSASGGAVAASPPTSPKAKLSIFGSKMREHGLLRAAPCARLVELGDTSLDELHDRCIHELAVACAAAQVGATTRPSSAEPMPATSALLRKVEDARRRCRLLLDSNQVHAGATAGMATLPELGRGRCSLRKRLQQLGVSVEAADSFLPVKLVLNFGATGKTK